MITASPKIETVLGFKFKYFNVLINGLAKTSELFLKYFSSI